MVSHVSRMPHKRLAKQALHDIVKGRRPVGQSRTIWTNCIEDLEWNRLRLYPSEMMDVMETVKCGDLIWSCCPRDPYEKNGNDKRRKCV